MAMTPIAQRLSQFTLKTIKRANPENLKKIEKAFAEFVAEPTAHDLQATFDVVVPKLGKERIRVTSDLVSGQKHGSIKATFARGKANLEQYAEDAFRNGYGFGKLLNAEARSKHLSPRFILSKNAVQNKVSEKSVKRYKEVLDAFESRQNAQILNELGDATQTKLLRGGQFRIQKQATNDAPLRKVQLAKRDKQNYGEFVDEGVKYAELLAKPDPRLSPKLVLKKNTLQNVIAGDGFQKYQQAAEVLDRNQEAVQSLSRIENAGLKIRGNGQLKVTDAQKRTYVLSPNNSANFEHYVKNGLSFANKAAVKNDNVSASLMLKNRFNKKISLEGITKFDDAARLFADNQALLDELKGTGVNVKLRYNGQLKITRQAGDREVFSKVLNHKKDQSLSQFIEEGLEQAKWASKAPLPQKKQGFFSRLFSKKQPPVINRTETGITETSSVGTQVDTQ